jgi:hypothetical protein
MSDFRWRRTAPFQKVIYMRPESLLSRRAETCRHCSSKWRALSANVVPPIANRNRCRRRAG